MENEHDLLLTKYTSEELEEITGTEKEIVKGIKQQKCTEVFTDLRHVLPDMSGAMMFDVKKHINLEMKRRQEVKRHINLEMKRRGEQI